MVFKWYEWGKNSFKQKCEHLKKFESHIKKLEEGITLERALERINC